MIYRNMEFHNVAEVEETPLGCRIHRYPKQVRDTMGEGDRTYGRYVSHTTTGCEIRFVTEGDRTLISLSSIDEDGYVQIYRGDFRYYTGYVYSYPVKKGQVTHIMLQNSPGFEQLDGKFKRGAFSSDVWRIMSDINFIMTFQDVETFGYKIRPPRPDEVPEKTLLCYGTSLTYGACATAQSISYVQMLGRLLECNILNKAMGGSCMNEKAVADYFASGAEHFDAVLLENAVNMSGMDEAYEKNAGYLLDKLSQTYPNMPIYCVTAYPNSSIVGGDRPYPCVKKQDVSEGNFRGDEIMRRLASRHANCHIIEGHEMLDKFTDLTVDLVHLSDYGHIRVAEHLAKVIHF